jgi:hypothetical protein
MSIAYIAVTVLAALGVGYSAVAVFIGAKWVAQSLAEYGVPRPVWPLLGAAKTAGAAGLLVGLFVPIIGVMAEIGLIVYFAGAVFTVLRARYPSHVPYPLIFLAPVIASAALRLAS